MFGNYHKRPWRTKGKKLGGLTRKLLETRTGDMTSIDQMESDQPGIIPQVTGAIKHAIFWESTAFVDHYYDHYYAHLMRVTSS